MLKKLLDQPLIYRIWQGPFAGQKFRPVEQGPELKQAKRVIDFGCGPGTNAGYFKHARYTGIDIDAGYIAYAQRQCHGEFIAADAAHPPFPLEHQFDFALLNSLLHHLDDSRAEAVLDAAARALSPDGSVHILDLILPAGRSIARFLAEQDRGGFPRPAADWMKLFTAKFRCLETQEYWLKGAGIGLWNMIYFKGALP